MNRRSITGVFASMLGLVLLPISSLAQQQLSLKDQLAGTWSLVSLENVAADGTRQYLYGPTPKGILILDPNGRYVQMYVDPDRAEFKSGNRNTGTPEEIKKAWDGTQAHFGVWSVSDADKIVTLRPEAHMFPNDVGRDQKRLVISLTPDELKFTNPGTGAGGKNEIVFRRAK